MKLLSYESKLFIATLSFLLFTNITSAQTKHESAPPLKKSTPTEDQKTRTHIHVSSVEHINAVDLARVINDLYSPAINATAEPTGRRIVLKFEFRSDDEFSKYIDEVDLLQRKLDQPPPPQVNPVPAVAGAAGRMVGVEQPNPVVHRPEKFANVPDVGVRDVIAVVDGNVMKVLVKDGDEVKEGAVLVEMENPDLEASILHIEAKRRVAAKELELVKRAKENSPGRIAKIELEKLEGTLNVIETELALAQLQKEKLTVVSPIAGKVITPNLHDQLIKRYVKKGDVLLTLSLSGQSFTVARSGGRAARATGAQGSPSMIGIPDIRVREIFAPADGEVTKVGAEEGGDVNEGKVLLQIRDLDLELRISEVKGQQAVILEQITTAERNLVDEMRLDIAERNRLTGERQQLKKQYESLGGQLKLLEQKKDQLTIVSPINGKVITPNVRERLIKRHVKKGELLLSIAPPGQSVTIALPSANATWTADAPGLPSVFGIQARRANAQALHEDLIGRRIRAIWKDQYKELAASTDADRDQKLADLKKEIRTKLAKSFDEKQAKHSQRVEALEQRLTALKKSVEEQKKNRDGFIEKQLEDVIGAAEREQPVVAPLR